MMLTRLARLITRDDGNTAIEFAFVFPVFIFMVLGIFEFSRALWTQSLLNYAVQTAARCGAIDTATCGSSSAMISYAVQNSAPLTVPNADFTVTTPACGNQVVVAFPFTTIIPQMLPFDVTISAQACYPKS
jgi:hypothetical protein